jgi:hypothetical protein
MGSITYCDIVYRRNRYKFTRTVPMTGYWASNFLDELQTELSTAPRWRQARVISISFYSRGARGKKLLEWFWVE